MNTVLVEAKDSLEALVKSMTLAFFPNLLGQGKKSFFIEHRTPCREKIDLKKPDEVPHKHCVRDTVCALENHAMNP